MLTSLRSRLMASYLVVVGLTLCVVATALVALLLRVSLPSRLVYQRLGDTARASVLYLQSRPDQIDSRLVQVAKNSETRILRVSPEGTVLFDSAGTFVPGEAIMLRPVLAQEARVQRGTYRDPNGRLWLYVGLNTQGARREVGLIVFAQPRPIGRIFMLFENNLLPPLLQAGLIGVVVAVILAVATSRSISRSLHRVSDAARAVAGGDYSQRVVEEGPREARELARAFNQMAQQVQRTRQMQRDFLANVSHELKTPLTSIQGYSQAILDGAATDPGAAARVIYDEAGRMRRLVEDLLDLARIESGQAALRREMLDLADLLDAVLGSLSLRASEKNISLVSELAELPPIIGDSDRLAQVFTNLLDNALTHTPTGGQVTVSAHQSGQGVEVTVSDTGPGISPDDLDRVFERFYQIDRSRARSERRGAGLGLAISKEIVEAHGGYITAKNGPNGGATFVVWLPRSRPVEDAPFRQAGW